MTTHYGLVGCGMIGQEHIRNIALLPDTAISAIYEPDAEMAAIAKNLVPGLHLAESLEALLAYPDLDALVIVTPNFVHADNLRVIAATKPLPILCEKPLYTDIADAAFIAELARTYPAPVWVGMEYRYMPPIAKLIDQAEDVTGGIRMLTIQEHRFPFLQKVGNWNRFNKYSGGTLVEKCCHFFDLMRFILKSDPVRVMASGGQEVNHLDETYNGERSDIWDCAYVIVDFESGARAMLELSMFAEGSRYQEELRATGPNGKIEAFVPGPSRFWNTQTSGPEPMPKVVISPRSPKGPVTQDCPVDPDLLTAGDHNGATYYQHLRFLEVIRGGAKPEVTLDDGAWAVRMGQAAQKSARDGCAVTF